MSTTTALTCGTQYNEATDIYIVRLEGSFDSRTHHQVKEQLTQALAANRTRILINLENTNFIDSAALSTLVAFMRKCRQPGGDLYLCSLHQSVRIIFELTRLNKAFDIFPTEEEAILAFG